MTERSALSELANFVAASPLAAQDPATRRRALDGVSARLAPRNHHRRSVGELLAAVLALSARTRRTAMPRVGIELDVFTPAGRRAVDICLDHKA